jgi:glycosyltransferase involved in cell wall biosynthesis
MINKLRFSTPREAVLSKNVLVYSPNIAGHRHAYSAQLIDYYLRQGFEVYFAYHGFITHNAGKKSYVQRDSKFLEAYSKIKGVHILQVGNPLAADVDELQMIVALQKEHKIFLTVYVDGDEMFPVFFKQVWPGAPRLIGRNYGVFIFSEFMYLKSLPWRQYRSHHNKTHLKRRIFTMYLFKYLDLLDGTLYSDEVVIKQADSPKFIHVPELGHANMEVVQDPEWRRFYQDVMKRFQHFVDTHKDKHLILCFGDLEERKGYDFLLKLCAEDEDLALIRVGRTKPGLLIAWDRIFNKEKLIYEDRLFELDHYVNSQEFMDMMFNAVPYVLMPYKGFLRTSSVMIQSLSYGKPLMVADIGLMRHRVQANKLGVIFKHKNYEDFAAKYAQFKKEYQKYIPKVKDYYEREFSEEAFTGAMGQTLSGLLDMKCSTSTVVNEPPKLREDGELEYPVVQGWYVAMTRHKVEISVNGEKVPVCEQDRPDLAKQFEEYPNRIGFKAFLPSTKLKSANTVEVKMDGELRWAETVASPIPKAVS